LAVLTLLAGLWLPTALRAAEKPRIQAEDYVIDATINPQTHKLTAHAVVKFVALDDISIASFELHNALRVTQVTDAQGNALQPERVTQDSSVRVPLPNGLSKGQETTLAFSYEGIVTSADDSPVPGLRLAYIGDPITYLLYSGRWFPVTNYGIDRFTARLNITVPDGYTVVSSAPADAGGTTVKAASKPAQEEAPDAQAGAEAEAVNHGRKSCRERERQQARTRRQDLPLQLDQAEFPRNARPRQVHRYCGERGGTDHPRLLFAG
jgi:hypothetical protein